MKSEHLITHKTPVFTAGSCFADAIGVRLSKHKFPTLINPFGVAYNPISVHKVLTSAAAGQHVDDSRIIRCDEVFQHYDFHSSFGDTDKNTLLDSIESEMEGARTFLASTNVVMITYGTSWVYVEQKTGEIVANCHKIPSREFEKRLLTADEIYRSFSGLRAALLKLHPHIRFILTVSPVRHVRDTLELNAVSKSVLRLACHNIQQDFSEVDYFPAYEIMMDDLRDYRFYKSDLIHPTDVAEDFIWEKFQQRYMSEETTAMVSEWNKILTALDHKPFHPASGSHQQFLKNTLERVELMQNHFDVSAEIHTLRNQLQQLV